MYVITKRGLDELDTQIVQGFGDEQTDAAIVFTREDSPRRILRRPGGPKKKRSPNCRSRQNRLFGQIVQGKDRPDPRQSRFSSDDDELKNFGVLRVSI